MTNTWTFTGEGLRRGSHACRTFVDHRPPRATLRDYSFSGARSGGGGGGEQSTVNTTGQFTTALAFGRR